MRVHGRLVKNMAGVLLLLALLSLLLPFCKFNAGAGDTVLSGIEVAKAGGKAGYTYFKTGGLPDDFVLKAPYTWGNVKESLSYVSNSGGTNVIIFCGVAILLPILLCFLAMCMLFIAEGKKTMFLPTLFTCAVSFEMIFVIMFITQLKPFLMVGVYLFAVLNVIALAFILFGWITGGYRQSDRDYENRNKNAADDSDNENEHKRKRSRKKKKTRSKKKKDKSKGKKDKKKDNKEEKDRRENISSQPVTGMLSNGTGIYQGFSCDLKNGNSQTVTIGTTPDAMEALESKSFKNMESIAKNNCKISYDVTSDRYSIESHSKVKMLLVKDGNVVESLSDGDITQVSCQMTLQINGRRDSIKLS